MRYLDLNELLANGGPGRLWGPWRLEPDLRLLVTRSGNYEIDLDDCTSSARLLDWICQIADKEWCDDQTLAGLVRALIEILHPQENLCSWGDDRRLSLARLIELVAESHQRFVELVAVAEGRREAKP
ncbi:hypothetical protein BH24ACT7_BH24ACT7_24140 [soil metagenome]